MLALLPAALELSALTALALVTAACCSLIAYDVIHYRHAGASADLIFSIVAVSAAPTSSAAAATDRATSSTN
jgi:hypothetical protein